MAVTITRAQLAARMRMGRTQTELDETDELLAEATEAVIRLAPNAPDVIHNMAVWRFCSYAYDRPFASAETRFANVMRNSGAAAALLPYRVHRLGLSGGDDAIEEPGGILIQQSPFTVTDTPANIAASYGPGRYRAEVAIFVGQGVLYATGPQPPATDAGYFQIGQGDRRFDFTVGVNPTWVKTATPGIELVLAVAQYAS